MVTPDEELERRIQNATSHEELRELVMQKALRDGVVKRAENNEYVPVVADDRVQRTFRYQKQIPIPLLGIMVEISAPTAERLAEIEQEARTKFGLK